MDTILETVKSSLSAPPLINGTTEQQQQQPQQQQMTFTSTATSLLQDPSSSVDMVMTTSGLMGTTSWDDVDADAIIDDIEFIDHGEGAGIEGDLDVEDE